MKRRMVAWMLVMSLTFLTLNQNVAAAGGVDQETEGEISEEDFLSEELYEDALESYMEQMANRVTELEDREVTEEMEKKRQAKLQKVILSPEALEKSHTYVELNYGKSYMTEAEEKKLNYLMCKGIHADCSLHFTEGILKNPVKRNYQYEYAKRNHIKPTKRN